MRPKKNMPTNAVDLFRSRLDQIIDLDHALCGSPGRSTGRFLEEKFGAVYSDKPGTRHCRAG